MSPVGTGIVRLSGILFLVGEDCIEEGDNLRVTIRRDWWWIRVSRIRFWWVIEAGEWIVVHVVEALVVATDPSVENRYDRARAVQTQILPDCIDSHSRHRLMHVRLG